MYHFTKMLLVHWSGKATEGMRWIPFWPWTDLLACFLLDVLKPRLEMVCPDFYASVFGDKDTSVHVEMWDALLLMTKSKWWWFVKKTHWPRCCLCRVPWFVDHHQQKEACPEQIIQLYEKWIEWVSQRCLPQYDCAPRQFARWSMQNAEYRIQNTELTLLLELIAQELAKLLQGCIHQLLEGIGQQ